ncbi:HD domain-containing protein [Flavobacteriaceae bacterium Ap0902]|nr:HD domain-containing protein [Flavobacteriaceae bacterium Ap0902]
MSLVQKVENFVIEYLAKNLSSDILYHNITHTERVAHKAEELAVWEGCSEEDKELLLIASWFHDLGYTQQFKDNEPIGAEMAAEFLKSQGVDSVKIDKIKALILATNPNVEPHGALEKIMKDADCSHVGADYFFEVSQALRKELELHSHQKIKSADWDRGNLQFLKDHQFFTDSAQKKWQPQKEQNKKDLENKINQREKKMAEKKKSKKFGRGVETMFRVTLKNHMDLSAIADTKANILLSINAIIISVTIANLLPKLDSISNNFLVYPTMVLLFFSVVSIILSVLSTRPNISKVEVTRDMIRNNQSNILFFGNFNKMTLDEFEWGIEYLIENQETLYNSLTRDLYYLGLVLERKYRLLRITYNVFMFGIVLSALAFVVSYFMIAEIS